MAGVGLSIWIAAPVERVFALATDVAHYAEHIAGISDTTLLTPPPVGLGTRFRETRTLFGRAATEEMEFVAFEPDERYTLRSESCGALYLTTFRFGAEDAGTRLSVEFRAEPRSALVRLLAPLLRRLQGGVEGCLRADLDDLKRAAEAVPAAAGVA